MTTDKHTVLFGDGDEVPSNHSNNPHINDLLEGISRRQVLTGGMAMGMLAFLGMAIPRGGNAEEASGLLKRPSRLPFTPVAVTRADTVTVPEGFQAKAFIPWGMPICGSYPAYREDGSNTAQEQAEQIGMHHDGMHYFPIDARNGKGHNSEHGLLVLNHEYIDAPLLHPNGPTVVDGKRTVAEEVCKEINAHGVSVVEIRRTPRNGWEVVGNSTFNRRITAATPMEIQGPARGHALLRPRLGATRLDRPEWGAVHPKTGEVYFTLTNNTNRTEPDAANPRINNAYGHIIRWKEENREHTGTRFSWNIFLLGGPQGDSRGADGRPLGADSIFASPDGLWFDPEGRLWIQTDMSSGQRSNGPFGYNQMLVADPETSELKRFLVGPRGCEVTGITATPDFRTLFINIQHPGEGSTPDRLLSTWPDGPGKRPRSATVVITREGWRRVL